MKGQEASFKEEKKANKALPFLLLLLPVFRFIYVPAMCGLFNKKKKHSAPLVRLLELIDPRDDPQHRDTGGHNLLRLDGARQRPSHTQPRRRQRQRVALKIFALLNDRAAEQHQRAEAHAGEEAGLGFRL
jgi:hypothetical protein